ncbi:SIS domain-containing protein [Candidatus Falkowbacteria bacterium]|nr:SIS domain-containing protein [Candidatus Falkowbacteria bacterium]
MINQKTIQKLDKKNMYSSIASLSSQCKQVLEEQNSIKIPSNYKNIDNIIVSGMGASNLGGYIIKNLYKQELKVPIEIVKDYNLPNYVNKKTLCIISSYSGTTEETLSTLKEARKKGAKIFIITTGGKLNKFALKYKIPSYIFEPKNNPCNEPRMGLGYSIFGQIIIFNKLGLLKITNKEFKSVIKTIKKFNNKFNIENKKNNYSLEVAKKIHNKIPIVIGSEILLGNIHAFNNQINENAKNFSTRMELPNINHHLLEGLREPKSNQKNLCFIFLNSHLYHKRNQKRYEITKKVIKKNKINFTEYSLSSKTKLDQVFEALVFGSYASFYLAMLNKINPSPVPFVDFFKKEIGK